MFGIADILILLVNAITNTFRHGSELIRICFVITKDLHVFVLSSISYELFLSEHLRE